ncbi:MAG: tRNA 2-selenouridine(34) synthase MnmH, partial [Candidatus Mcinerneyibacterium aminivorans]
MVQKIKNKLVSNFYEIVVEDIPLIDVRSPKEFRKGSFPNTVNLPLMNNEERHKVGKCYSEKGHCAAVKLGNRLVSGEIKEKRLEDWENFIKKNPNSVIYCLRGGLRSKIVQSWIEQRTGKMVPRLEGGFKALRNYMIEQLQPKNQDGEVITLGGYTGSGKTILLNRLENSIDLEGLANHRGSGFGNYINPQPTPINFENRLATELIKHWHNGYDHLIIEDESKHIGRLFIPKPIFEYFTSSPLVILETPIETRVDLTFNEYVIQSQKNYISEFGEKEGLDRWYDFISNSFDKIKRKLGGKRHDELTDLFHRAFKKQINENIFDMHKKWIKALLQEYYDPMYEHHMEKTDREII